MWIRRLNAANLLPGYENVELEFTTVNVFLGGNNSGKTSFLKDVFQNLVVHLGQSVRSETVERVLTLDVDPVLAGSNSTVGPIRLLGVDRVPPTRLDTREMGERPARPGSRWTGVGDFLAELHEVPLLRPELQFEIGRMFGVNLRFESEGYQLVCHADDDRGIAGLTLDRHGRGIQYYAALFLYLYHPEVKVLLIDEPENSLHPQLQRALMNRIRRVARERDKQVLLATHSPIFALPERAEDLRGVFLLQRRRPVPRIFPLSRVVPTDERERTRFESFLPNLDPAIAEPFFADGTLIVEGQTERLFLQNLASMTARDIHGSGITIVESNGLGLMPGFIRIVRGITEHWRAICDGDLLKSDAKTFKGYREDFSDLLGVAIEKSSGDVALATREAAEARGVSVLSRDELERYYQSSAAADYFVSAHAVKPQDKGWLLAEELAFLRGKTPEFINTSYAEILGPLDALIEQVTRIGFNLETLEVLTQDILFADAERIHRQVFRNQWSEEALRNSLIGQRALGAYELTFISHERYELHWRSSSAGVFRIRCESVWFFVECRNQDDDDFRVLRQGTVHFDQI